MNELQIKLCDIQGRLFELSVDKKCPSKEFVKTFMNSAVAKALDSQFNHMQWAGEEYLFDELLENNGNILSKEGRILGKEVMYWIGYIYRYWHFYSGESSSKIYKTADVNTLAENYIIFRAFNMSISIDNLKEIFEQNNK